MDKIIGSREPKNFSPLLRSRPQSHSPFQSSSSTISRDSTRRTDKNPFTPRQSEPASKDDDDDEGRDAGSYNWRKDPRMEREIKESVGRLMGKSSLIDPSGYDSWQFNYSQERRLEQLMGMMRARFENSPSWSEIKKAARDEDHLFTHSPTEEAYNGDLRSKFGLMSWDEWLNEPIPSFEDWLHQPVPEYTGKAESDSSEGSVDKSASSQVSEGCPPSPPPRKPQVSSPKVFDKASSHQSVHYTISRDKTKDNGDEATKIGRLFRECRRM